MNTSDKLISIIMPTFNVEDYITKSITSILSQETQNYRLIIVDDHSTDKTIDIIRENFISEIQNEIIKIIVLDKNSGPGTARQIGIEHVNTPYVTFIDSDDSYISKNVTSLLETYIKKYSPDCIMFKYVTDHGTIKIKKNYKLPQNRLISNKEAFIQKINNSHPIWHYIWNKCYKTNVIKKFQIQFQQGARVAEDVRFNEDFLIQSQNLIFINKYLYLYNCTNSQSISKSSSSKEVNIESAYHRFIHECNHYEQNYQYTKILNCEKECIHTLKYNLGLTITKILIRYKRYPWYKDLKKQIIESPYFLFIKPVYYRCYLENKIKNLYTSLKKIIKHKL